MGAVAENICEGFDHPEAPPLDVDDAARQLREATQQRALQDIAAQQGKDGQTKRKKYGAWGLPF